MKQFKDWLCWKLGIGWQAEGWYTIPYHVVNVYKNVHTGEIRETYDFH